METTTIQEGVGEEGDFEASFYEGTDFERTVTHHKDDDLMKGAREIGSGRRGGTEPFAFCCILAALKHGEIKEAASGRLLKGVGRRNPLWVS